MAVERAPRRGAILAEATRLLAEAGLDQPRGEALRLWRDLADRHPADALIRPELPLSEAVAARILAAAARRAGGEPLAYVTGRAGFRRLELAVDRRALIPRPETEGLVDLLLERAPGGRAADIGTGTGALALSLAAEGSYRRVLAVELSEEAVALAAENRRVTGLPVDLLRGDLCEPLATGSLDALVSNPPYLSDGEYAALDPAVRAWEPAAALASGPDGLRATSRLLQDGLRVLRPGGWIAVEVDCTRASEAARRASSLGWEAVAIHTDLYGRERYLLARRSATS